MIRAYLAQRFPPAVFVPAIALLATAAWAADADRSWRSFLQAAGAIAILVAQFRLWDDLEDRDADRLAHPERVATLASAGELRVLLFFLHVTTLVVFARRTTTVAALLALDAATWLAYRRLRPRVSDTAWRHGVLPMKYPAFVALVALALGGSAPLLVATSSVAAYVGACAFEVWSERASSVGVSP